jgi:hypothetical protein
MNGMFPASLPWQLQHAPVSGVGDSEILSENAFESLCVKCPLFVSDFNQKIEVCRQTVKPRRINSHENPSVNSGVISHVQTDMTKLRDAFRIFFECA